MIARNAVRGHRPKLRLVDVEADHTVIAEPSVTEWHVNRIGFRACFWPKDQWDALPDAARPASAQKQGEAGYLAILPA